MGIQICSLCDKQEYHPSIPEGVVQHGICPDCAEDEDDMIEEPIDYAEEHHWDTSSDDDDILCPWCRIKMRCKDPECNIEYCPECGWENIS